MLFCLPCIVSSLRRFNDRDTVKNYSKNRKSEFDNKLLETERTNPILLVNIETTYTTQNHKKSYLSELLVVSEVSPTGVYVRLSVSQADHFFCDSKQTR